MFFFEALKEDKDYASVEDKKIIEKLNTLIYEAYTKLGYDIIRVPPLPIKSRVEFTLERVKS